MAAFAKEGGSEKTKTKPEIDSGSEQEVDYFELFCRQAGRRRLSSASEFGGSLPSDLTSAGSVSRTGAVVRDHSLQVFRAPVSSYLQVPESPYMRRTCSDGGQDGDGLCGLTGPLPVIPSPLISPSLSPDPKRRSKPTPLKLLSSFKSLVDSCDGGSPCISPGSPSPPFSVGEYHKCPSAPPSRSSSIHRRHGTVHQPQASSVDDPCGPSLRSTSPRPRLASMTRDPVRCSSQQNSSTDSAPDSSDYYRVRHFVTTPRGIVNCGDSFRSKSMTSVRSLDSAGSGRSYSLGGSAGSLLGGADVDPPSYHVVVLGAPSVGKTTLVQQLLTSECIVEKDGFYDLEDGGNCVVSVLLNDKEATLHIAEVPSSEDIRRLPSSDAYLVTYATNDHVSFHHAAEMLYKLRNEPLEDASFILVANKTDLVRIREVAEQEGKVLAETHNSKYMEVSALMNLQVDELLAGTLNQIRLRREQTAARERSCDGSRSPALRFIGKILRRQATVSRSCDNLLVL